MLFQRWWAEAKESELLIMEFNTWLTSILLFEAFKCFSIVSFHYLKAKVMTLPLLQRLRLQRRNKLLSAMGSPPPSIFLETELSRIFFESFKRLPSLSTFLDNKLSLVVFDNSKNLPTIVRVRNTSHFSERIGLAL